MFVAPAEQAPEGRPTLAKKLVPGGAGAWKGWQEGRRKYSWVGGRAERTGEELVEASFAGFYMLCQAQKPNMGLLKSSPTI